MPGLREAVGIRSHVHFSRCYMTPLVEKGLVSETAASVPAAVDGPSAPMPGGFMQV